MSQHKFTFIAGYTNENGTKGQPPMEEGNICMLRHRTSLREKLMKIPILQWPLNGKRSMKKKYWKYLENYNDS